MNNPSYELVSKMTNDDVQNIFNHIKKQHNNEIKCEKNNSVVGDKIKSIKNQKVVSVFFMFVIIISFVVINNTSMINNVIGAIAAGK